MARYFVMRFIRLLFFSHIILYSVVAFGQSGSKAQKQFEKARKSYLMHNVDDAIEEAVALLGKHPDYVNAALLLADIYYDIDSTEQEIIYLEKANEYSDKPAIAYRLAEANYSIGLCDVAIVYYKKYLQTAKVTEVRKSEIRRKIENCEFAVEAKKHPVKFHPKRLPENINSANDEYWPSLSINQKQLVFTRLVKEEGQIPNEDFFISKRSQHGWGLASPIVEINTPKNEGAQSISVNGKLLFFTACNRASGYGSCDIYYSVKVNGKWGTPKNVGAPVNGRSWETQPSLSSNNRYLYFSSNRRGGKGRKDIWRAELLGFTGDGKIKWGEPENLGDSINTPGNEISPFIHANNKNFYFASDYRIGMGGFDLFTAKLKADGSFSEAENMGYPINTIEDEQGLIISADGVAAFFSSARNPSTGLDIYTFELAEKMRPQPVTYARAKVIDAVTQKPVRAKIELVDLSDLAEKRTEIADEKGVALLCFPIGSNYAFNVSEKGYLFYSQSFQLDDSKTVANPYKIKIKLKPIELGGKMNLYNIYFETDSFAILPESEPELQKLVAFLTLNPELKVEVQGHTDNSGNSSKNLALSELRAKSVVNYLVGRGIARNRLTSVGYGENRPVATNETKKGRKLNRRTTIKIVGE